MTVEIQGSKKKSAVYGRAQSKHLAIFWFAGWPVLSVVLGAFYVMNSPNMDACTFTLASAGVLAGMLYMVPEFLVTAAILFLVSWLVFWLFPPADLQPIRRYLFEPAIAFVAISFGISLEYPSILNNSAFTSVRTLPLFWGWVVIAAFLLLMGGLRNGIHRSNITAVVAPAIIFVAVGWGLTKLPVWRDHKSVNRGSTVLLGIDSMGYNTNIAQFRTFARQNGGAFYEKAVTPGLTTNAVWTAIVQHRPIHETGVTIILQNPDWNRSPFQLIREAKRRGYQTWSFFTGQSSIYTGSTAGFDYDRSGPMGWLDSATAGAKNGSIFAPFVASRLPKLPFSRIRRNQAGTFGYDLRAVVDDILTSKKGAQPVFAVSHVGYLHDDAYPRFSEFSKWERNALLITPIESIKDAGRYWQVSEVEGDPIDLRDWKYQNVQRVIIDELLRTKFLAPENQNRLVILSDHGVRTNLNNDNFADERYYRVPLITFGVPARDVHKPISLLDMPSLVGFDDPSFPGPAEPAVEYTNWLTSVEYVKEILAAHWTLDGRINLRTEVDKKYWGLLKTYDAYALSTTADGGQPSASLAPDRRQVSTKNTIAGSSSSIPAR